MSAFSNFQYSFQNDSTYRKKTYFFVATTAGVMLLVGLFIWLNFSNNTKNTSTNTNTPSTPAPTVQTQKSIVVTAKNFEDTTSFSRADNEAIGYPNELLIQGNKLNYINSKYYFRTDQNTITTPVVYGISTMLSSPEGIIINESFASSIYKSDGKISSFPQNTFQVYPVALDVKNPNNIVYYFLEFSDNKFQLFQSLKLDFSDKQLITQLKSDKKTTYQYFEIRKLGSKVYLVAFANTNKTGDIDFYSIENNSIVLSKELTKVESFQYATDKVIYSIIAKTKDLASYQTSIIDFSTPKLDTNTIDVGTKLAQDAIFGDILAQRCQLQSTNLYCLVKKNKVAVNLYQEPDIIAKIDLTTQKVSYILQNNVFSATSIFVTPDNQIYFVGQENNMIYKINNVDKA
jgi:hypothetical protein